MARGARAGGRAHREPRRIPVARRMRTRRRRRFARRARGRSSPPRSPRASTCAAARPSTRSRRAHAGHCVSRFGAETLEADAVVVAVPAAEAARIAGAVLVAAERTLLAGVRYDAAITWTAPARGAASLLPTRVRSGRAARRRSARSRSRTASSPRSRASPGSRAHAQGPDDALAKEIAAEVERLLPGIAAGSGVVRRFPLAWPRFDVGHYRAIARLARRRSRSRRGGPAALLRRRLARGADARRRGRVGRADRSSSAARPR